MSDAEDHLAQLWAAAAAPAHDLAFTLAVEEKIARRLMLIDVAVRLVAGLACVATVVAFGPLLVARLGALAGALDTAGPVLAAVAVLGAIMVRLIRGPGLFLDADDGGGAPN